MKIADGVELWTQTVERLRSEIGDENTELWLKPVEALSLEGGVLMLKVPNKFFSDGIKERYQKRLISLLRDLSGNEIGIDFRVERDLTRVLPPSDPVPEASPQSDFPLSELNPRYTFDSFVIGAWLVLHVLMLSGHLLLHRQLILLLLSLLSLHLLHV